MGGECMDERAEVKKKLSRWVKAAIWAAGIVVFLVVSVLIAATAYDAHRRHVAEQLAELPPRERNLAVFDAACELLKTHYYNPEVFRTETWRAYEAHWRAQAEAGPTLFLYPNVLSNFGARFLDSHLGFEAPATAPSAPPDARPAPPVDATSLQHFAIFQAGPGFEVATIRRGRLTAAIIDDVRRGSAAERAGITPGWALPFSSTNLDARGVRFTGTFLELGGADALIMERTGHPPGVEMAGPGDAYTLERGVELTYEPDLSPPLADFDIRRLAGNVTYLRFDSFDLSDNMNSAFDAIEGAGPEGLVIDLRHNFGGTLWPLQRFLGRLLGNDADIGNLRGRGSSSRMRTWRWGSVYRGSVVILIGPQTMSAAEITAAAVQDHHRGKLVGRMTNGSVLNSKKYSLPDGGTMLVPVKDFYRTGNRRIEGVGVEPDIHVMPTLEDIRAGRDAALDRALQELAPR